METPKSAKQQTRTMRIHTPRLSERKKKLFENIKVNKKVDEEEGMITGIEPLSLRKSKNGNKTPKSTKTMDALMGSCNKTPRVISFFETESDEGDLNDDVQKSTPSRRSVRLSLKKSPNSSKSESEFSTSPHKENIPLKTPTRKEAQEEKHLQKLFNNSMQITPRDKSIVIEETTSEEEEEHVKEKRKTVRKYINKRHCEIEGSTGLSPLRKIAKTSSSPVDGAAISTKSFYSSNKISPTNLSRHTTCRNLFGQTSSIGTNTQTKSKQLSRRSWGSQTSSINRGVHHKIRKRTQTMGAAAHRHYAPVDIDHILHNVRNEKLRKLITAKREEKQQIEMVHNIFRKASNPIAMARPLSSLSNQDDSNNNNIPHESQKRSESSQSTYQADTDFSDIECESDMEEECAADLDNDILAMDEEIIPMISHQGDDVFSTKSDDNISPPNVKKKFFKSGRNTTTRKEVKITDNIKATMSANGKLTLVEEKKKVKKRIKIRTSVTHEFSDEQATVDAILRNLDDTAFGDVSLPKVDEQNLNGNDTKSEFMDEIDQQLALIKDEEPALIDDIQLDDNQDFTEFRKRLPYNTSDVEIIERQHLLLDFLISNNICTEENFTIFIGDPDNHKEEAERIVDELVMIVTEHQNTDFRQRIPCNTTDPELIAHQHSFLDFLLENNICTEENFDIFIANYDLRKSEADAILSQYVTATNLINTDGSATAKSSTTNGLVDSNLNSEETTNFNLSSKKLSFVNTCEDLTLPEQILQTPTPSPEDSSHINGVTSKTEQKLFPLFYPGGCQPLTQPTSCRKQQRSWNAGFGLNQYQIDAGQKEFGAHQCKQCGLVYTIHEPEEEKLHRDFHASLHMLRFKGWIDEDIVAIYPEWGPDGRILRLTESSPLKRRERLMDILKIVDKELGFSSYIIPKTFVAYFAVRKMQIVGLCLVQPLDKANKYICVNGVDCCTEEQFEAKCGISRIWVSPLHRRFHIGSKLMQAVQLNTIFGEEVSLDKIAFSAPTEMGKTFAQQITKTESFLVYQ